MSQKEWHEEVQEKATNIRKVVLKKTIQLKAGYLGQTCSCAEILATMISHVAKLKPSTAPMVPPPLDSMRGQSGGNYFGPKGPEEDRIIISAAHYAIAIYGALIADGRLSEKAMEQFNASGTIVEQVGDDHSPGFELVTGSFGQVLGQAGGIAMARKNRKDTGRVLVFMADGELEEGSTWESIMVMAHYKLDNMIVFVDVNGQQCDGLTKDVMNIEPITGKIIGFGADCYVVNGHDPVAINNAVEQHQENGRPTFILCYTDMATGIAPLKKRAKEALHFISLKDNEVEEYQACLDNM